MSVLYPSWLRIKDKISGFYATISTSTLSSNRLFNIPNTDGNIALANNGEPNGFPDRSQFTLSWNNGTRTLTLTPVATNFSFWSNGTFYTKTSASIQISNVEGNHYIYFDSNGNIQELTTFNESLISTLCYIAGLYWDAVNSQVIIGVINETHGSAMPANVHSYLHTVMKTQYVSGMALSLTTGGNGSLDSHSQFSATAGAMKDEDIDHTILLKNLTSSMPVVYLSGSNWRQQTLSFPLVNTGTGRAAYNQNVGGNWQLTEALNNNFVLTHIFAYPGINYTQGGYCAIIGQATYSTLALAQAGAKTEAASIVTTGLPISEFKLVATLIIKTSNTYANTTKSSFQATDTGASYIDWRGTTSLSSNTSPTDHNALSNLQGGIAGEYYHLNATDYTALIGTIPITRGGTGQTTQQAALNALAGGVTSGQFLRGNGTNIVLSAIQNSDLPLTTINSQAGNYTLALSDYRNVVIEMTSASANTLTIPTNASVAFPNGATITAYRYGTGVTTIQATTGVILNGVSGGSKTIDATYQAVLLIKRATNEWVAFNK